MWRRAPELLGSQPRVNLDLLILCVELDAEVRCIVLEGSLKRVFFEMDYRGKFFPCLWIGELAHQVAELVHDVCRGLRAPTILELVDQVIGAVYVGLVSSCGESQSSIPIDILNQAPECSFYRGRFSEPVADEARGHFVDACDGAWREGLQDPLPEFRVGFALILNSTFERTKAVRFQVLVDVQGG